LGATDPLVAPVAIGLFGVVAGLLAFILFAKIKKSPEAGELVKSPVYKVANIVVGMLASLVGAILVVYALATAVVTLLALQEGFPYAEYYLGQFLPTLLLGGALIGMTFIVKGFAKAKISTLVISLVPWIVAMVGCVLILISVGVASHGDNAGKLFGIDRASTIKSIYDYYDF
jgi:ABC-type transport system involved in multi-copper enzyme maturation permease subunit